LSDLKIFPRPYTFKYVYQYKDHLENIRLSYSDSNNNGTIELSEIIEENNYYPFGLKHKGYNNNVSSNGNSTAQKLKFQGQELEQSLGLNNYEFGLRQYDASLGRWFNSDPYEQFDSPYVAMGNNPIVSIDPDGGYCYDANGNQITCPESDIFDEFRNDENNNTTILPEVTPGQDDGDSNSNDDSELSDGDNDKVFKGTRKKWFDTYVAPLRKAAANKRKEEWLDNWRKETEEMQKGALNLIGIAILPIDVFEMIGGRLAAEATVRGGKNWVYISKNAEGVVDYVGITNNLLRRAAEHLREKGIIISGLKGGLSRADARAVEQALIEIHKLGKNGGSLMNKINSISPSNPIYAKSLKRGFEILKAIGYKIK
jgi:RHS repeat-associated protein